MRVGEVGDCLPIGNVGRDVEAALAQGEGMRLFPRGDRVLANRPASGEGKGEKLRDRFRLERRGKTADHVEQRAKLLNFLIERSVEADGFVVRESIGDTAGSEADEGADEIVVLWFEIAAHGLADGEQADGIFGIANGEDLFEAGVARGLFGEEIADSDSGDAAGEGHMHLAILANCSSGAADHEASHDGAKEMSKEVFRTEGSVEQFR